VPTRLQIVDAVRANPLVVAAAVALALAALYGLVATLVPICRREIRFSTREVHLLRWSAVAAVIGVWIYEIVRLA
jgi:hypothetical protein